jgi:hypothetical protein
MQYARSRSIDAPALHCICGFGPPAVQLRPWCAACLCAHPMHRRARCMADRDGAFELVLVLFFFRERALARISLSRGIEFCYSQHTQLVIQRLPLAFPLTRLARGCNYIIHKHSSRLRRRTTSIRPAKRVQLVLVLGLCQ